MSLGDNCSSACLTKDHATFGECVRSKGLKVGYCGIGGGDATAQRRWDSEIDLYKSARAQGIQPASTSRASVERAMKISEATGVAWQSDKGTL